MNKLERKILRELILRVIKSNENVWWEAKREAHMSYVQSGNPHIYEYEQTVRIYLKTFLSAEQKIQLFDLAVEKIGSLTQMSIDNVISAGYTGLILEEISRRAYIGAMKTIEW